MTQTGEKFTYYVVFQDSGTIIKPWRWFTRKGFRHCSVFMACEGGTINVNQSLEGIRFYTYAFPVEMIIKEVLKNNGDAKVVKVDTYSGKFYGNKLGTFFPTCVSLCQRITGLTFHAFTPYHYFRALLKSGGQLIWSIK